MNWRFQMEMNYPPYTITDKMLNLATSIIRKHQEEYYTAIQNCNNEGNSNEFIGKSNDDYNLF